MTDNLELIALLREQKEQRNYILFAIVAVGAFLGWVLWPAPDLTGIPPYERCEYMSYARTHGGTVNECHKLEAEAAGERLRRGTVY